MRLTVEIKDGKFIYSWEVGPIEKLSGEMDLTADGMCVFVDLLRLCTRHEKASWENEREKSWRELLRSKELGK